MAMKRLALMPAEGDEVGRRKDQIVLADLDSEVALHGKSPQRSQPPSSITTNIAAHVRSAVVPGLRRFLGSLNSRSSSARARNRALDLGAPSFRTAWAPRDTASASSRPSFRAIWVSGVEFSSVR